MKTQAGAEGVLLSASFLSSATTLRAHEAIASQKQRTERPMHRSDPLWRQKQRISLHFPRRSASPIRAQS